MKAQDIIEPGETAVVIFTRGTRFKLRHDGSASTGNWRLRRTRNMDKVIVYKRVDGQGPHEIYVGVPIEIIDSEEEGRREVRMSDVQLVGTTHKNWNQFTGTKPGAANPFKYITRT